MYNPMQVVNQFIEFAKQDNGSRLTHMQLQKLLYIAHGVSLACNDKPLLSEPVCAWKYGPVIPVVYDNLKAFRSGAVDGSFNVHDHPLDPNSKALVKSIYDTYGKLSGIQLSEFTHRPNTPWSKTWAANEKIISNELIKDYYKRLMQRDISCQGL
ncbi:Panacea domain-containing protein [Serratia quinivorans]|uniref:Panacea domain-containing protein n=1 Tax=Serratia quinivorans TaxID=137545 RepID=UPI003F71824A